MRNNIKKILRLRDQRDYKEKVKVMFKDCYNEIQKKFQKSVSLLTLTPALEETVPPEWDDWSYSSANRLRDLHHECG